VNSDGGGLRAVVDSGDRNDEHDVLEAGRDASQFGVKKPSPLRP
jgi:hypothetical protein